VEGCRVPVERANDPRAFRDFLDAKLSDVGDALTLDEALGLWDLENAEEEEQAATVEAIREALDDMRAGDTGVPAREFVAEIRRKYNLPTSS
jgi:hypothetical protein